MRGSMADIQSATVEIRRRKIEERKKKPHGKNIMLCPIPQGDHNEKRMMKTDKEHTLCTLRLKMRRLWLATTSNIDGMLRSLGTDCKFYFPFNLFCVSTLPKKATSGITRFLGWLWAAVKTADHFSNIFLM